jgi:hypothetical protein
MEAMRWMTDGREKGDPEIETEIELRYCVRVRDRRYVCKTKRSSRGGVWLHGKPNRLHFPEVPHHICSFDAAVRVVVMRALQYVRLHNVIRPKTAYCGDLEK